MCECPSTRPGVNVVPGRSITFAPAVATSAPTASMRSPFTRTAHPSCIVSPSKMRAGFRMVIASFAAGRGRCCAAARSGTQDAMAAAKTSLLSDMRRIIVKRVLNLSDQERAMLDGERGPAPALAMSILVRMADVYGASELMDISQAHIDSTIYLGDATLEFAERLASLGAKVAVPTSLNVSGVDECGWKDWAVKPEWAAKAARQMLAYERMGAVPMWTCAPYQTHMRPVFGQQIAWGESNAISFANSVIGARTERYPDLLDICCAITGRVPAVGLHLTENRGGQILLRLSGVPPALQRDDQFFAVLGHLVGTLAGDRIPVIDGIVVQPAEDQLKAFAAAAASSGRVALFHMVGVTPEAPRSEEHTSE